MHLPSIPTGPAIAAIVLYVLPSLDAIRRGAVDRRLVLAVNLAFGWTVLGWIIALTIAERSPTVTRRRRARPPAQRTEFDWAPPEAVEEPLAASRRARRVHGVTGEAASVR
jgi:hypothetical protein